MRRALALASLVVLLACGEDPHERSIADASSSRDALVVVDAGERDAGLVDSGASAVCDDLFFECRAAELASSCPDGGDPSCQAIANGRCLADRCSSPTCASTCDRTSCVLGCHQAAEDALATCRAACTDGTGCGCSTQVLADRTACDGADPCTTLREIVGR